MKFQFKHQQFQADAAAAVCDVFSGQRRQTINFSLSRDDELAIGSNAPIELNDGQLLANLRGVQRRNGLVPSEQLDGRNFSVEMETGVGKTYTYIKTMYELNRRYGWSKFIVVVPSVAIREGVRKTFAVTAEHFAEEYGERIRHFVYSSKNLSAIQSFVGDAKIWAMIINVQAFSARSSDARRMLQSLDEFQSRVPIEVIAQVRPIVIIDEPQSVEGPVARKKISEFKPLMTLRYSATHKNLFNQVYRLDALDAYQRRLVKKISVKGIEIRGDKSAGYVYFERVNLSHGDPTATVTINHCGRGATKRITRKISVGDDLFELSGGMDDYRNFIVTELDGEDGRLEFLSGVKIFVGQAVGDVSEENFRRIQIRETIQSHLERESQLYNRGIKVLSLFFIDEVAKYRARDNSPGLYARLFEEEYAAAVKDFATNDEHRRYLDAIAAPKTHAGYFSVDRHNRATNTDSDDAYNLIMRDKERLLDLREPVRFIFSHSALREGWDNPNVFQICALKQSSSDVRRRQEVGRGMRLCVNLRGERMDAERIGDVHDVNILTVVANESYRDFAAGLQREISEAVNRPQTITREFLIGKQVDERRADEIIFDLISGGYIDRQRHLTEKFYSDAENGTIDLDADIVKILREVGGEYKITDARTNVTAELDAGKFRSTAFRRLWEQIRRKAFYRVEGDSDFTAQIVVALNKLVVPEAYAVIERGTLRDDGTFDAGIGRTENFRVAATTTARTDLIGKLTAETGLTRRDVSKILRGLEPKIFTYIERDSDKFLRDAVKKINDIKAAQLAEIIEYIPTDAAFDEKIFHASISGRLNDNAVAVRKNLYDYLIYDSTVEKNFAADMDSSDDIVVYVKLPREFKLPTPRGMYNPDWAVVLREGAAQKIFFVVETKGGDNLRDAEKIKTDCATKYFDAVTGGSVKYHVVTSYREFTDFLRGGFK